MSSRHRRPMPGTYRPERRWPRPGDLLLTGTDVARLVGVDPKTVSEWARSGRIPSILTPDQRYLFRDSEIRTVLGVPDARP